jgi:archaemetzincin
MNLTIVPFASGGIAVSDVAERLARRLASIAVAADEKRPIPAPAEISSAAAAAAGCRVLTAAAHWDPAEAYDAARGQYRARKLLERLPPPAAGNDVVLGITALDLYIPVFTFVFGEGLLGGRRCLVSGFRLDNARYGDPPDPERLTERVVKEATHELGHAFGLVHCRDSLCVMRPSGEVGDVDVKSDDFCAACRGMLRGRTRRP